ncbi:MAG: protein kinase [Myxococcota bacterium]
MSLPDRAPERTLTATPAVFGNYLLDDLIAEGGMARVFRARLRGALGFEKPLVVKQVRPELAADPRFIAMFAEEAKTLVRLGHPHIVPVYELGVAGDTYFIAMEYVDGVTLESLGDGGVLPPELVAHLGVQICEALAHAHETFGLVHRDVTPRNVMVDRQGHARLLDFGIAVTEGEAAEAFGSRGYMSPEQFAREQVGAPSDLFSLGCVLYEALNGTAAFREGEDRLERVGLRGEDGVGAIVETLFAEDPSARPHAADVARSFRAWLSSERPEGVRDAMAVRVAAAAKPRPPRASEPPRAATETTSLAQHASLTAPVTGRVRSEPRPAVKATGPVTETGPVLDAGPASETGAADSETGTRPITGRLEPEPSESSKSLGRAWWSVAAVAFALALVAFALRDTGASEASESTPATEADGEASESDSNGSDSNGSDSNGSDSNGADSNSADSNGSDSNGTDLDEVREARSAESVAAGGPNEALEAAGVVEAGGSTMSAPVRMVVRALPAALTVGAVPWGEVKIDGTAVGTTPLRNLTLTPGAHRIEVFNPALGRRAQRRVQVEAGERLRLSVDLSTDPPTLRVRR